MKRLIFTAAALCCLAGAAAGQDEARDLAEAARRFYTIYLTFHPSDGIPDPATRARLLPVVSPALDRLFADGEAAEAHYAAATRHLAPPLVEGDLFTPNFEGATAFRIGACRANGQAGQCEVNLTYDAAPNKPVVWTDTAYFTQGSHGWRLDDIAYGGAAEFGNKGRLTHVLEAAIADGNGFSQ